MEGGQRLRSNRIKTLNSPTHPRQPLLCCWPIDRIESASTTNKWQCTSTKNKLYQMGLPDNLKRSRGFRKLGSVKKSLSGMREEPLALKPLSYFMVGNRNNQKLVGRILEERNRWSMQPQRTAEANLLWGPAPLTSHPQLKPSVVLSRIPGSNNMTNKGKLYQHVSNYCEKHGLDLNFLPITFFLSRQGPLHLLKANIQDFCDFFRHVQQNTSLSNTWIIKPTNLNQGRDIHLFDSEATLTKLLALGRFERPGQKGGGSTKAAGVEQLLEWYVCRGRSVVLQKYIENPWVIGGYKFDIRMWVLVDHLQNYYIFQEGYLRFSSRPYNLDRGSIADNFVHLTNHALQKYSPTYSSNQCLQPMAVLKEDLLRRRQGHSFETIERSIRQIVGITVRACLSDASTLANRCFELFGYDFLVDRELNVRLIEVNCNPAITLDNELLGQLIPKMLNDAFKLTIDKIFGTSNPRIYHVPRLNGENGWVKLGNIQARVTNVGPSF